MTPVSEDLARLRQEFNRALDSGALYSDHTAGMPDTSLYLSWLETLVLDLRRHRDDLLQTNNIELGKRRAAEAREQKLHMAAEAALVVVVRFAPEDFPEPPHEGSCGPESGCDANCMTAAWMAGHNAIVERLEQALKEYD